MDNIDQKSRNQIETLDLGTVVSLKVARAKLQQARDLLDLANPLTAKHGEPRSVWMGPDHWLLMSDTQMPSQLIKQCDTALGDLTFSAVDFSDALIAFRLSGESVRELLGASCGLDFRVGKFNPGNCQRTRFAQISVTIECEERNQFLLYIDPSYTEYLGNWLKRDNLKLSL